MIDHDHGEKSHLPITLLHVLGVVFASITQQIGDLTQYRVKGRTILILRETKLASTTVVLGSESEPARRSQATADTDGLSAYPGARNKRAQMRPVNAAVRMGTPWRPAAQRQYPGSTPLPGERCRRL